MNETKIIIVGAGGIGSYLLPQVIKLLYFDDLSLIDNDLIEFKNLYRQNYTFSDVMKYKVDVLSERSSYIPPLKKSAYIRQIRGWFTISNYHKFVEYDGGRVFIFSAVDNHPARLAILDAVDSCHNTHAIIAGNNTIDHSAYYYNKNMKNTCLDPRVRFPNMFTDKSDDPTSCQSVERQMSAPQTALANEGAALMATMLAINYVNSFEQMKSLTDVSKLPYEYQGTRFAYKTITMSNMGLETIKSGEELFNDYE